MQVVDAPEQGGAGPRRAKCAVLCLRFVGIGSTYLRLFCCGFLSLFVILRNRFHIFVFALLWLCVCVWLCVLCVCVQTVGAPEQGGAGPRRAKCAVLGLQFVGIGSTYLCLLCCGVVSMFAVLRNRFHVFVFALLWLCVCVCGS